MGTTISEEKIIEKRKFPKLINDVNCKYKNLYEFQA